MWGWVHLKLRFRTIFWKLGEANLGVLGAGAQVHFNLAPSWLQQTECIKPNIITHYLLSGPLPVFVIWQSSWNLENIQRQQTECIKLHIITHYLLSSPLPVFVTWQSSGSWNVDVSLNRVVHNKQKVSSAKYLFPDQQPLLSGLAWLSDLKQ